MRPAYLFVLMAALPSAMSASACPWPEVSGERLLGRGVDTLSVTSVDVEVAVAEISKQSELPLSFIHSDSLAKISLDLRPGTVRQALDAIVEQAPEYRYAVVGERLVMYPRDPIWETRLDDVKLGPGPRVVVTGEMAKELARRLPAFADLGGPWILGDSRGYTYRDVVSVRGPGSILELLLQLPGSRPSTFVIVDKNEKVIGRSLSVSSRDQLWDLKVTAPATTLQRRGETVQLKVIGALKLGGEKDLSAGACGTAYSVSDERVLGVSPDGAVSARASGDAEVKVTNEHSSALVTFKVTLPGPPAPAAPPAASPAGGPAPPRTRPITLRVGNVAAPRMGRDPTGSPELGMAASGLPEPVFGKASRAAPR
jgi:hypothetical protein